jgi:hypothetical protein
MSDINEHTIPSSRSMDSDKTMLRFTAVIPSIVLGRDLCEPSLIPYRVARGVAEI